MDGSGGKGYTLEKQLPTPFSSRVLRTSKDKSPCTQFQVGFPPLLVAPSEQLSVSEFNFSPWGCRQCSRMQPEEGSLPSLWHGFWDLKQEKLSLNLTGCTSPTFFSLLLHKSKSTVSIPANNTFSKHWVNCQHKHLLSFYGCQNWGWERLNGVILKKSTHLGSYLARARTHSSWLRSPVFCLFVFQPGPGFHFAHMRSCAYVIWHSSSRCHFGLWGHSPFV